MFETILLTVAFCGGLALILGIADKIFTKHPSIPRTILKWVGATEEEDDA